MPRPTLPQNGANARVGMAESSWMTGCRPFVGYGSGPGRAAVENYKEMKDLSKDSVNRLVVGEDGDGQRIDNFLQKLLKGVPKSHIYRILRSGEVRRNRGRVGPDARLAAGDELRIPPIRTAEPKLEPTPGEGTSALRVQAPVLASSAHTSFVWSKPEPSAPPMR